MIDLKKDSVVKISYLEFTDLLYLSYCDDFRNCDEWKDESRLFNFNIKKDDFHSRGLIVSSDLTFSEVTEDLILTDYHNKFGAQNVFYQGKENNTDPG